MFAESWDFAKVLNADFKAVLSDDWQQAIRSIDQDSFISLICNVMPNTNKAKITATLVSQDLSELMKLQLKNDSYIESYSQRVKPLALTRTVFRQEFIDHIEEKLPLFIQPLSPEQSRTLMKQHLMYRVESFNIRLHEFSQLLNEIRGYIRRPIDENSPYRDIIHDLLIDRVPKQLITETCSSFLTKYLSQLQAWRSLLSAALQNETASYVSVKLSICASSLFFCSVLGFRCLRIWTLCGLHSG